MNTSFVYTKKKTYKFNNASIKPFCENTKFTMTPTAMMIQNAVIAIAEANAPLVSIPKQNSIGKDYDNILKR
jgi:hypothetical protein